MTYGGIDGAEGNRRQEDTPGVQIVATFGPAGSTGKRMEPLEENFLTVACTAGNHPDARHAAGRHPRLGALLAELRAGLEALYGTRLKRLVLYGSQARGEARAGSDVDVLVVLEGPVHTGEEIRRTSNLVARLSLKHEVVLSRLFKSETAFAHERSPLLLNVRREGVAV